MKWAGAELNRRHTDFQSVALPTELPTRKSSERLKFSRKNSFCKKIESKHYYFCSVFKGMAKTAMSAMSFFLLLTILKCSYK